MFLGPNKLWSVHFFISSCPSTRDIYPVTTIFQCVLSLYITVHSQNICLYLAFLSFATFLFISRPMRWDKLSLSSVAKSPSPPLVRKLSSSSPACACVCMWVSIPVCVCVCVRVQGFCSALILCKWLPFFDHSLAKDLGQWISFLHTIKGYVLGQTHVYTHANTHTHTNIHSTHKFVHLFWTKFPSLLLLQCMKQMTVNGVSNTKCDSSNPVLMCSSWWG